MALADLLKSSQPTGAEKKQQTPVASGGTGLRALVDTSTPLSRNEAAAAPAPVPVIEQPKKTSLLSKIGSTAVAYNKQVNKKIAAFDAGALEGVSALVSGFQWLADTAVNTSLNETQKAALQQIEKNKIAGKDTARLEKALTDTGFQYQDYATKNKRLTAAADKLNEWGNTLKGSEGITPQNQTFVEQAFEGAGSSVVYFVPGLGVARGAEVMAAVSPKIAMLFGNSTMTALEAMSEAGQVYSQVEKDGKGQQAAIDAGNKTFMVNALVVGVSNQLGILNPARLGPIKRALLSAPLEGLQEAVQQVTQNVNTGQPTYQGVFTAGAIGTILGPFLGGAADIVTGGGAGEIIPNKKAAGAGEPPKSASPLVQATADLATKGPAAVRDELGTLQIQQQLNPTNTELAQRIGMLQSQLDDYFQTAKQNTVDIREGDTPLLTVDTLHLADNKIAFSVDATAGQNTFSVPVSASDIFATKEQATKAALDAVKAWASTQVEKATDEAQKAEYQRVLDAASQAETKPSNAPVEGTIVEQDGQFHLLSTSQFEGQFATEAEAQAKAKELGIALRPGKPKTAEEFLSRAGADTANAQDLQDLIDRKKTDKTDHIAMLLSVGARNEKFYPLRTAFQELTGKKLPKGGKQVRAAVEKYLAETPKTQKEKVKAAVAEGEKSVKQVAAETGILEPNVRRILGVGAKDGTFTRVDKGVYTLTTKDGKAIAYVHAADAIEALPRLAKEGLRADMVFLDIPYDTPAVKGGNRGANYNLISVSDFKKVMAAVSDIVRTDDAPVFYMYSQAQSGFDKMTQYNDTVEAAGFKPVARGEYQKTYKDGAPVGFPTQKGFKIVEPEGIIVFNKSGNVNKEAFANLNFKLVRPKGYQTEKPAEMIKAMIEMSTKEGDVVLDPFAGSGVTGEQAIKTGRTAVVIEKDANQAKNIVARMEKAIAEQDTPTDGHTGEVAASAFGTAELSGLKNSEIRALIYDKKDTDIFDPEGALLTKVAAPTYGRDVFLSKPQLLKGEEKGIWTDSFALIQDKAGVARLYEQMRKNKTMAAQMELVKEGKVSGEFPNTEAMIKDFVGDKEGEEMELQGYVARGDRTRDGKTIIGSPSDVYAILSTGKKQVAVAAKYLGNMRKYLPGGTKMYFYGDTKPVVFRKGKEIVGLLMPINPDTQVGPKPRFKPSDKRATPGLGLDVKTPSGDAMAMYKPEDLPEFPVLPGTGIEQTNAIEFPEMVDIARDLMGKVPDIVKRTGNAAGRFKAQGGDTASTRILLVADLFKEGNLVEAGKVLAHEIGHLVDFLPEGTLRRGNLIGRLKTLQGFMSENFGTEGALDTKTLRNEATREVLKEQGKTFGDFIGDKAVREAMNPLIKTRYNEKITESGGIRNKEIRKELLAVTRYWHPYDPENVPKSYKNYRESSKELYAEAVSMLYNSPGLLEQMAPTFYEQFFAGLDAKPNVKEAYFKVQELMQSGDREKLVALRRTGVQQMFTEGEFKSGDLQKEMEAERDKRNSDVRFRLRFELVDKNSRIIDLVDKLEKSGTRVNPDDNPVYYLEERNYLGGKIKAIMERDFNPVYQKITGAGLQWNDFGELLFYERIVAGDRSEQANPRGITPAAAQELITAMQKQYGPEQFAVMESAAKDFRTAVKKIATEAHTAGLYTDELYKQMLENPAYVSFRVIEHLEDAVTSRVYKSIGTLKDITNPADATLLKVIATIRAIEQNTVKVKASEMLTRYHPTEIEEAKYRFNGQSREPVRPKGKYQELITYYEKGRLKGVYVDEYIASSLNNESAGGNNMIVSGIRFMNGGLFRPLFITFNLGFQSFNLIRDFLRFYKNVPGMTFMRAIKRYKQSARISKVRAFGGNGSQADQQAEKILQSLEYDKVFAFTFNDLLSGHNDEERQIERILRNSGIEGFAPETGYRVLKPLKAVLDKIERLGNLIETLPKAGGYYEFTDLNKGGPLTAEQRSFIRKNIGSPDFLAGGYIKPATNEVFLFSNAITQGIRSDYNIAVDPKTRSGFWWKTAKIQFIPKMLMYAALAGAFGDAIKKMFEDVSEYDMTNYLVVPVGREASTGKTIYFRIPTDETSRFLGGILWKSMALIGGKNNQSVGRSIMDIASYTGGQLPSISPVIQTGSATLQFLAGNNPYDAFKGRQVLSDDVYKAGGLESTKAFAGWAFQQLGGGVFTRFYYEPTAPDSAGAIEKFVNLPVLGNIIGRFVRVSDYGTQEKLRAIQDQQASVEARARLSEKRAINSALTEAQSKGIKLATSQIKSALVTQIIGHTPNTTEELAHANRIKKKFDLGLKRGYASPEVTSLIDADTNKQRLAILKELKGTMTADEFAQLRKDVGDAISADLWFDPSLK